MTRRIEAPTRAEMALLEPFAGLTLDRILVPATAAQSEHAAAEIAAARFVGFDTESKPTFAKGEVSDGPHTVQFATLERAYVFQLHRRECHPAMAALLRSPEVVKVGFGLRSDRERLERKLGVQPCAMLDLCVVFRRLGYRKTIGARTAVAAVLRRRLQKSKRTTTSNWARQQLAPAQLLYAANDAYAAIRVLDALDLAEAELPIADAPLAPGGPDAPDAPPYA